jgi:hypothetical protein
MAPTHQTDSAAHPAWRASRRIVALLWLLTLLFAARVCGQAIQWLSPRAWLPAFDAFQGSRLPYWLLLPTQMLILVTMATVTLRLQQGRLAPKRRAARALGWAGGVYMAVALGRIAVGLWIPAASDWYRSWIPAAFHVVLAGFVLVLFVSHRMALDAERREPLP